MLTLPFSARPGKHVSFFQALFTATSATCVTGLTVVDTGTTYSVIGQLIILLLIQVGGLGFMIFATATMVMLGRRVTLRNRLLLNETMSISGLSGTVRTGMRFLSIVFVIELIGSIIMSLRLIPQFGVWRGIYYGVFHTVSAFCNAGFDLFGPLDSLTSFSRDPYILLTIASLIVAGGLGFMVIADMVDSQGRAHKFNLHTKIVVSVTATLLLSGLAFFAIVEWNNPLTLGKGLSWGDKLVNAWFQSVTCRTAGYYSITQGALTDASKLFSTVLMFIGASPASTGGGVKTTTLFVLLSIIRSVYNGEEDITGFRKRMPLVLVRTAQSILFISLGLILFGGILMALAEQGKGYSLIDLVFEEVSALATVGLSSAGSKNLSVVSQSWLIMLMYLGRVGPLTMMLSFTKKSSAHKKSIRFPEEDIIVG